MESYPLLTGILCYLIGLIVGVYSTKGTVAKKVAAALQEGLDQGRAEAEEEKAETGKVLTSKLRKLQETLVETLDAYEDTVKTVDEKLSPQAGNQLSLEYKPATRSLPQPDKILKEESAATVPSDSTVSQVSTMPHSSVEASVTRDKNSELPKEDEQRAAGGRGTGTLDARETGSFTAATSGDRLRKTIFSRSGDNGAASDSTANDDEETKNKASFDPEQTQDDKNGSSGNSDENTVAAVSQVH